MRIIHSTPASFTRRPKGLFERFINGEDYQLSRRELQTRRNLVASMRPDDVIAFISYRGDQIVFVWNTREVAGRWSLKYMGFQMARGTWTPELLLQFIQEYPDMTIDNLASFSQWLERRDR